MSSKDFESLLSKSVEDLYELLGRSLIAPEYSEGARIPRQAAVQRGRKFISDHSAKLKAKICVEWHYCNKRGDFGNFQTLAYAIAPLASTIIGVPGTTAMIVAIILIKAGLDKFCNCPNVQAALT